jgi:hypothetical protein
VLKRCSKDDNIHILIIQIELFMYEFFSFLNYGSNASLASMHGTPLGESAFADSMFSLNVYVTGKV